MRGRVRVRVRVKVKVRSRPRSHRRRRLLPERAEPQQERAPCGAAAELEQRGRPPLDPLGVEADHRWQPAGADRVQPLAAGGLGGGGRGNHVRRGGGDAAAPVYPDCKQHCEGERGGRGSWVRSPEVHPSDAGAPTQRCQVTGCPAQNRLSPSSAPFQTGCPHFKPSILCQHPSCTVQSQPFRSAPSVVHR